NDIARAAGNAQKSDAWLYHGSKGAFGPDTNKCNLFCAETMAAAGVPEVPLVKNFLTGKFRPPTAGEWADPNTFIPNWEIVSVPQPGDIIAEAHEYSDATGHVGIVVGPGLTASAASTFGGEIRVNDWGFRPDAGVHPTFRRYVPTP